ncbi:MAG: hypothetical protein EB107_14975, partial [Proteobacteria bacterium]|nr:hypothetical protein [Pseudomonadota bacterium]
AGVDGAGAEVGEAAGASVPPQAAMMNGKPPTRPPRKARRDAGLGRPVGRDGVNAFIRCRVS